MEDEMREGYKFQKEVIKNRDKIIEELRQQNYSLQDDFNHKETECKNLLQRIKELESEAKVLGKAIQEKADWISSHL